MIIEHPTRTGLRNYVDDARDKLKTMGWLVQAVGGGQGEPAFSYSMGLSTKFDHPEIAIVGFDPELCRQIINEAASLVRDHGVQFRAPVLASGVIRDFDVAFRPVTAASSREKCRAGRTILETTDYPLVQLFFPDPEGYFPWQRKCDRKYAKFQTGFFKLEGGIPTERALTSIDAPAAEGDTPSDQ